MRSRRRDRFVRFSISARLCFPDLVPSPSSSTCLEKASIDEAYLDLSAHIRSLLLTRYPYLSQPPSESPLGLDTPLPPAPELDWESSEWGIPPSPIPVDGAASGAANGGNGWSDVALWLGGEVMENVRMAIEEELSYTTSAGLGHNKILAKVCSAYKKPRAQVSQGGRRRPVHGSASEELTS